MERESQYLICKSNVHLIVRFLLESLAGQRQYEISRVFCMYQKETESRSHCLRASGIVPLMSTPA